MCGIAVLVDPEGADPAALARAAAAMKRRGPDAQRFWRAPHGRVGLVHARLGLVDLVGGHQPLASEDEAIQLVAHGEFYDHERLRAELVRRGHQFRTGSDSEIALHLYEERGVECLAALRGEFAFALWDEREQLVFAARDRFGIKPLFYAHVGERLWLASEVRALWALGVPRGLDDAQLHQQLFATCSQERSIYTGVRQLPAGQALRFVRGRLETFAYWDPAAHRASRTARESFASDPREAVARVRAELDDAIRLRLRADVPVGCYLSGGLDSCAALGAASRLASRPLAAFTVAFDHADYDESPRAARMAAHAGAEFHRVRVTEADAGEAFEEAVRCGLGIHYNAHGAARYLLSRAVHSAGFRCVLGGEGSDEVFLGYEFATRALERSLARAPLGERLSGMLQLAARLMRAPSETERALAETSPWLARIGRVLGFPPSMIETLYPVLGALRGVLAPDFLARHRRRDPFAEVLRPLAAIALSPRREPVFRIVDVWLRSFFVQYVLAAEQLDAANAVEVRLPFLDHRLFETLRELPARAHVAGPVRKWLLREATRDVLTDEVYCGVKNPFIAPPTALRPGNPLHKRLEQILRDPSAVRAGFVQPRALERFLDSLPARPTAERAALDPILFMLASLLILRDETLRA